jgi:hypothetical protein
LQTNPLLLPTVTSFIPGLRAGAPFRVSIHSWYSNNIEIGKAKLTTLIRYNPEITRYVQHLKKPTDQVVFEARVFIDGKIAG